MSNRIEDRRTCSFFNRAEKCMKQSRSMLFKSERRGSKKHVSLCKKLVAKRSAHRYRLKKYVSIARFVSDFAGITCLSEDVLEEDEDEDEEGNVAVEEESIVVCRSQISVLPICLSVVSPSRKRVFA